MKRLREYTPTSRAALLAAVLAIISPSAFAASGTWSSDSDGVWSDTSMWSGGIVADGTGNTADFSTIDLTGARTVTLDAAHTIGSLNFADATPDFNWNLVGPSTLTLGTAPGLINVSNQTATINVPVAGTVGLTKTGNGTLTFAGTNTYGGTSTILGGTVTYAGASSYTNTSNSPFNLSNGVVNINTTGYLVISNQVPLGGLDANTNTVNGSGAINQSSGTFRCAANNGIYLQIGAGTNSYGSYNLSGGTLTIPNQSGMRVGACGTGVFLQSGGILTCDRYMAVGTQTGGSIGGKGQATFTGGTATIGTASNWRIVLGDKPGATGVMNLGTEAGGTASITHISGTGLTMIGDGSAASALLNLNSGSLTLGGPIYKANSGGSAVVNFNGATLRANGTATLMNNGNSLSANVYNGGIVLDSQTYTATVSANLLAATGNGIYPAGGILSIATGGSGYIGAPLVAITTSGSGSGATAIANVSGGTVTGVTMTCPGKNYIANDTLTFAFNGGGSTNPASFSYALTANDLVANTSGGVTKLGSGIVILSGANTYTGGTTNSAGTLRLGNLLALGDVKAPLTVNGGTIDLNANSATIGALGGTSGTITDSSTGAGVTTLTVGQTVDRTFGGALANGSTKVLTLVKNGAAKLTLTGVNTHTNTVINAGTLALSASGSIANSTNILIASGATFDVSAISFTAAANQTLSGSGTVIGSVNTVSGSKLYAGTDGTYGTNTFSNDLTLAAGAITYLDLGAAFNGTNDQVVVNGNLTLNNNILRLKAPSTAISLDTTADYVLFNVSGNLSGAFSSVITWDVQPLNYGNFSIVTDTANKQVRLHYTVATPPTATAVAAPSSVTHNQSTIVTVTVTPGSYPINAVTVDASPIGGAASVALVRVGLSNVYTNAVTVSSSTSAGAKSLMATATDTASLAGIATIELTVTSSGNVVWDGAAGDAKWSSNLNWVSGFAPGLAGDSLTFAGTANLAPSMDNSYSVSSLQFDATAGSFVISATANNTLTLTGGLTNNSVSAQTLNVPVVANGAQVLDTEAGDVVLGKTVNSTGGNVTKSGSAKLTYTGVGANTLSTGGAGGAYSIAAGSVVLDGTAGTQTNTVTGDIWVGYATNAASSLTLTNTTLNVSTWLAVDRGNGNNGYQSVVTLNNSVVTCGNISLGYDNGQPLSVHPSLVLNGTSKLTNYGLINLGESTGADASVTVSDAAILDNSQNNVLIGNATSRGVLNLNSSSASSLALNNVSLRVGGNGGVADTGVGAINQTAGTLNFGNNAGNYLELGAGGNAYGSFNLTGGSANETVSAGIRVGAGGLGSFTQTGGTLFCGRWFAIGTLTGSATVAGKGVATFTGGSATVNPGNRFIIGDKVGSTAALNIGTLAGGSALVTNLGGVLTLNGDAGATNSALNLNSGTLQLGGPISRANTGAANLGVVNLNGGTLQAGGSVNLIDNTPSSVSLFNGGVVVDSQANTATVSANLLAATGNGIYPAGGTLTIPSNGGVGYIGAPLVTVTGGSGSGAMAVANLSNGGIASVTLTAPGQGYVAGDALSFVFNGGGATTPATTFAYTLQSADVAANATGGLTKVGQGTLVLSGVNSYVGNTRVSNGILALAAAGSINNTPQISLAAGTTFDVSAIASFALSGNTVLSAASATLKGGTEVNLGAQPVALSFTPAAFTGDVSHPSLFVSQGNLTLNGVVSVSNNGTAPLGYGTYALITTAGGTVSGTPSLASVIGGQGIVPGAVASLQFSGTSLNLLVQGTTTTTLSSVEASLPYGTAIPLTATVSPSSVSGTVTFKSGATILGSASVVGGVASYTTSASQLPVGGYSITAVYNGDANYLSSSSVAAPVTIHSVVLTVTGLVTQNRAYDSTKVSAITGTPVLVGVMGADDVHLAGTPVGTFATASVGTDKGVQLSGLTLVGATAPNYTLLLPSLTASITGAPLTITAENKSRMFNVANSELTVTYEGFVGLEDVDALTTVPTVTTTALKTSPAGEYPITPAGAAAANYLITYKAGTLTVIGVPPLEISVVEGQAVVSFPTAVGMNYQLESNTDLNTQTWTLLNTPAAGTGAAMSLTNTISGNCFFRLQIQQ